MTLEEAIKQITALVLEASEMTQVGSVHERQEAQVRLAAIGNCLHIVQQVQPNKEPANGGRRYRDPKRR